jgi:anti-sigma B factor antagonist
MRLAADQPALLIVNLSAVQYMDSSGVATLVQALQQVKRYNGRLVLVGPNERVRSIFQIARLDSIFEIEP